MHNISDECNIRIRVFRSPCPPLFQVESLTLDNADQSFQLEFWQTMFCQRHLFNGKSDFFINGLDVCSVMFLPCLCLCMSQHIIATGHATGHPQTTQYSGEKNNVMIAGEEAGLVSRRDVLDQGHVARGCSLRLWENSFDQASVALDVTRKFVLRGCKIPICMKKSSSQRAGWSSLPSEIDCGMTRRQTFGVDSGKPALPSNLGLTVENTLMSVSTRQRIIQDTLEIMNLQSPSRIAYCVKAMDNTIWDVSVCIRNPSVPNVNVLFEQVLYNFITTAITECIVANDGYVSIYQIQIFPSFPDTIAFLNANLSPPAMGGSPKGKSCVTLRRIASRMKIKGSSRMKKAQLLRAIQKVK